MCFAGKVIGDDGVKQLAKSLAKYTTLTSLDLGGSQWCSVTPAFACIGKHTHVYMYTHVCLFYNHLNTKLVHAKSGLTNGYHDDNRNPEPYTITLNVTSTANLDPFAHVPFLYINATTDTDTCVCVRPCFRARVHV